MTHLEKQMLFLRLAVFIIFYLGFQTTVRAARADVGFYAGPLSAIAETVIETAETTPEPSPSPSAESGEKSHE